jgi:hypothetical protein
VIRYLEKWKKKLSPLSSPQGWTKSLKAAVRP